MSVKPFHQVAFNNFIARGAALFHILYARPHYNVYSSQYINSKPLAAAVVAALAMANEERTRELVGGFSSVGCRSTD